MKSIGLMQVTVNHLCNQWAECVSFV